MQAHLQLFDDDPLDVVASGHFARWHQPVKPEKKGNKLALAGGPHHERQSLAAGAKHEPLLRLHLVDRELEISEHASLQQFAVVGFEAVGLRKQRPNAVELTLHQQAQALAECPNRIRVTGLVIGKRPGPPVCQRHDALRRHQKHRLGLAGLLARDATMDIHHLAVDRHLAVGTPDGMHALAEVNIQKSRKFPVVVQPIGMQLLLDQATVLQQLDPLQADALATGLRPDQHGQVAEVQLGFFDLPDVAERHLFHGVPLSVGFAAVL